MDHDYWSAYFDEIACTVPGSERKAMEKHPSIGRCNLHHHDLAASGDRQDLNDDPCRSQTIQHVASDGNDEESASLWDALTRRFLCSKEARFRGLPSLRRALLSTVACRGERCARDDARKLGNSRAPAPIGTATRSASAVLSTSLAED